MVHRFDEHGAHLYHMDPSGTYLKFDAKAIGSGSEGAQQSLQVSRALILKRQTRCSLPFSLSVVMSVLQKITRNVKQCCGAATFWVGSGSRQ